MPVITIASTKGGVGKSTLAINLAITLQNRGREVAVIDSDRQSTVVKWNRLRENAIAEGEALPRLFVAQSEGKALIEIAKERSDKGEYVLIDSAGADTRESRTALVRTDFVLTVVGPSAFELWEIDELTKIVGTLAQQQKREIPVMLLFNKVSPNPSVTAREEALEFMEYYRHRFAHIFESQIKDRIDFRHSGREGKAISEYAPKSRGASEVYAVTDELLRLLSD